MVRPDAADPVKGREWKGGASTIRWFNADGSNQGRVLTGNVVTDGSLIQLRPRAARRAGWAATAVDEHGAVTSVCYGAFFAWSLSAYMAELYALLQALRHGQPPLTIWLDCESVDGDYARGKEHTIAARKRGADIWRTKIRDSRSVALR